MASGITHRDTTHCKLFVGGLPYHTTDETLKAYFDPFGEIEEAVVITDRHTLMSKGYGFVTMLKPEDAQLAIRNQNPIIDGRKANVNLAYIGAKPANNTSPRSGSPAVRLPTPTTIHPVYYIPVNHPLPNTLPQQLHMLPQQLHIPLPRQPSPTTEFQRTFPMMPATAEYFIPYIPQNAIIPQQIPFQPHPLMHLRSAGPMNPFFPSIVQ